MRFRHLAAVPAAVLVAVLSVPAAASAANASRVPWQPYRTAPWTDAPGDVCTFGVATAIVADQEQYRTLASHPDGSPKLQEFRGPLVVRYTNTSTNESVVRNLSGYGWFHFGADGGISAFIASHIGLTVPVGNAGFPPGEWVISGQSEVSIASSGPISVQLLHATAENLCRTLS